jgi:hypothetical protein
VYFLQIIEGVERQGRERSRRQEKEERAERRRVEKGKRSEKKRGQ